MENYSNNKKNVPLIQMKIEPAIQRDIPDKSKKDILKVLIYIYYYEKNVLNDKKGINFNKKEKYYLIKSKWIKELKNYYDYQKISKYLDNFKLISKHKEIIPINLNHLSDNNLLERIKLYLNQYNSYLLKKQPNEALKEPNITMLPTKNKNNFIYYSNGYIINSKILNIFENYIFEGQTIRIKPISLFHKVNNIFISLINKPIVFITIGNLNDELIFIGNSFLSYNNSENFVDERDILLTKSFKDYLISRNCQENILNPQTLKKEIDNKFYDIGQFIRIHQANKVLMNSDKSKSKRFISSKDGLNNSTQNKTIQKLKNSKIHNIINQKDSKIDELEKEVSRLKNILNSQSERDKEIENLNNECNKLRNENINKDNLIKKLKVEIDNKNKKNENELTNKINEIIELQRKNQELKKELNNNKNIQNNLIKDSKQKDEQIQKLKNEHKINMEEKEKEIKNINQIFEKESQKIKNSMFDLQNQLNEKEKIVSSLIEENKNLKYELNNENVEKIKKELKDKKIEINNKMSILKDKENIIQQENKEFIDIKKKNEELKRKNIELINKNKILENQLKQKQIELKQSYENINNGANYLLHSVQVNQINEYIDYKKENQHQLESQSQDDQNQNSQIIIPYPLPSKEKDLLEIYKEPTLIGLNNIGATCFMNSTLQCLSQTKSLTNYFLKDSKYNIIMNNNIAKQDKNLPQLTPVYLKLIKKLWEKNNNRSSFSPNEFMGTVEKMNPLFKKGQAGDSKDFIIFILEQIHKELKRSINPQKQLIDQPLNQYDRNNAFKYFMNDFQKECSIISDVFFGLTETTNICLYCKNLYSRQGINYPICYNYGIFNCLIFPLEEVKNFRNNYYANFNIQINQNNNITLNECFFFNQKTEKFENLLEKIEIIVIIVNNYLILNILLEYIQVLMY